MKQAQHTATPWKISTIIHAVIGGQGDKQSCVCELDRLTEANAAFIVRACNSHDALVEALRDAESSVVGILNQYALFFDRDVRGRDVRQSLQSLRHKAEAALALAEKGGDQ